MSAQQEHSSTPASESTAISALVSAMNAVSVPVPDARLADLTRACLTDFLAASLYASQGPVAKAGLKTVSLYGAGDCTLLGQHPTASPMGAAFHNGLAATAEDLDDAHRFASGLHMSAVTFPVALALGEAEDISGERLIQAVAAGYEVAGRLTRAVDLPLRARGFHSTGAVGPFGACATAAVLLGLSSDQRAQALGIAASGAGGLFAFLNEGSTVRHAHSGWACANGLSAAMLAKSGLTGPSKALDGTDGYFHAYAGSADERAIREQTGNPEIASAYHKLYATCGHAFPAITALQTLRPALPQGAEGLEAIASIEIRGYKATARLTNVNPTGSGEAAFSLPVIAGIVLLRGNAAKADMAPEHLSHPLVRRLAPLVQVVEDPDIQTSFPRLRAAEVLVTLRDGTVLRQRVDAPLGMPENPVSLAQLEDKLTDAAKPVLPAAQLDALLAMIGDLRTLPSVRPLVRLARRPPATV